VGVSEVRRASVEGGRRRRRHRLCRQHPSVSLFPTVAIPFLLRERREAAHRKGECCCGNPAVDDWPPPPADAKDRRPPPPGEERRTAEVPVACGGGGGEESNRSPFLRSNKRGSRHVVVPMLPSPMCSAGTNGGGRGPERRRSLRWNPRRCHTAPLPQSTTREGGLFVVVLVVVNRPKIGNSHGCHCRHSNLQEEVSESFSIIFSLFSCCIFFCPSLFFLIGAAASSREQRKSCRRYFATLQRVRTRLLICAFLGCRAPVLHFAMIQLIAPKHASVSPSQQTRGRRPHPFAFVQGPPMILVTRQLVFSSLPLFLGSTSSGGIQKP